MNRILTILLVVVPMIVSAQTRDKRLTIHATTETGEILVGQEVVIMHTGYQMTYGSVKLDDNNSCTLKVYEGEHIITIQRPGFDYASSTVMVDKDTEITINLVEKVRLPYSVMTEVRHDAFSGHNDVEVRWNEEAPAFIDDFESYEPFAITFSPWCGIDNDRETAAALIGDYQNRGVMQYAQIINPLTVEPTWWYDYEVLRPYSGKQYVGFTRTMSGNANDDWFISPVVSVGTENVLSFFAKAADKYPEHFQVYVTTVVNDPKISDFEMINEGNYESVDYTEWHEMDYDLSSYTGKDIRFAIHYIGDYNRYGSFMLMVDDVFVGQRSELVQTNPHEHFVLYLDGEQVATTDAFHYTLKNVSNGHHVIGIKAQYVAAETEIVTREIEIDDDNYANVTFGFSANSKLAPKGISVSLLNKLTTENYLCQTDDNCQINIPSLPKGDYILTYEEGAYEAFSSNISVGDDMSTVFNLVDRVVTPFNITVTLGDEQSDGVVKAVARWNQELSFNDSFEDYDDFATGHFGGWTSLDLDQMPVYPIGLGSTSNVVSFPGSGSASNPIPVAPMVFNPWTTTPAMLPTDKAMQPPTGEKQVVFFSPQRGKADKWLISPKVEIHDNYVVEFTAKAYSIYPESMEICISTEGDDTKSFKVIAAIDELESGQWTRYRAELNDYAGQKVRVGLHYTSYDAFFAQVDDVMIGSENGEGEIVDFGNVVRYEISLDGKSYAVVNKPEVELLLVDGEHTLGVKAVYQECASEEAFYTFDVATYIKNVIAGNAAECVYTMTGQKLYGSANHPGVYICNGRKFIRR